MNECHFTYNCFAKSSNRSLSQFIILINTHFPTKNHSKGSRQRLGKVQKKHQVFKLKNYVDFLSFVWSFNIHIWLKKSMTDFFPSCFCLILFILLIVLNGMTSLSIGNNFFVNEHAMILTPIYFSWSLNTLFSQKITSPSIANEPTKLSYNKVMNDFLFSP